MFKGFVVEESHIVRKPEGNDNDFEMEIHPKGIIFVEEKTFELRLSVKILGKSKNFSANIVIVGIFGFANIETEKSISNYFYTNAPAILYPYARAHIAALTALTGMGAVHIPIMNLVKLCETLKENTVEIPVEASYDSSIIEDIVD